MGLLLKFFNQSKAHSAVLLLCLLPLLISCQSEQKVEDMVISSILPAEGPTGGGTSITITGTNFDHVDKIKIGDAFCASFIKLNNSTVQCTTPPNSAGYASIKIIDNAKNVTSKGNAFLYRGAPTISSISPNNGPAGGGQTLTFTGTNFYNGVSISFGSVLCQSVSIINSTTLTCVTQMTTAGAKLVTLQSLDGQTAILPAGFTFNPGPSISSLSPSGGTLAGGVPFTITGTNFEAGSTVTIDGGPCSVLAITPPTSITCTPPANTAGAKLVTVSNLDGQTITTNYTYRAAPTATAVLGTAGPLGGGVAIFITGTNFYSENGVTTTATLGGFACTSPTVLSSTSLRCITPAHIAATVDINVTNPDGQTATFLTAYTYQPAPTVTNISPDTGILAGGENVTITGTGFLAGSVPYIGGLPCTSPVVTPPNTITCLTPAHTAGDKDVVVVNTDNQSGSDANAFTYVPLPTITTISPASGITAGGTNITITGTNFIGPANVEIDGVACAAIVVVDPTSITCTTPANAIAGAVDVVVTNADTQSVTRTNGFTYLNYALISWIVGGSSPTPPNPDTYGPTAIDEPHTYTLENEGDAASSAINVTLGGADPGSWLITSDTCTGNTLAPLATCTVEVTFQGGSLLTGAYSAIVSADALDGGTTNNDMNGSVP